MHFRKRAAEASETQGSVSSVVADILTDVQQHGEVAVRKYEEKFGGVKRPQLRVSEQELDDAISTLDAETKGLIETTVARVIRFAEAQKDCLHPLEETFDDGIVLGHRFIPIASVGAYVPGGRFPLLSSAAMVVAPARVAGVPRIVACSPANYNNSIHPAVLYGLKLSGATEIYAIGGAQAIAMMAYGMEGIAPVDFLSGPGNRFVAEAKRQAFGDVGIDLIAGPSEVLVLADETGDAETIARDLLAQAEHDPFARAILVTTSDQLADDTITAVERVLASQPTTWPAQASWLQMGEVVVAASLDEAIDICNDYAIEHLHVQTKEPRALVERLTNYGSLFLGEQSSVVFSDKVSGTNHTLPTKRAARYTGGLWVGTYLKVVTHQEITGDGTQFLARHATRQSQIEGLVGHEMSAAVRLLTRQI
ncbi:histidinol dehydrogenase [Alicyclobacillus sp. ALC3]|uniref:histidinol dehydrogenase n=1 Tax=Alicyclobacillus sp. ALC3 TaxID=2796143 RepID=UPI002378A19F|nr:histidinol dehydrogenase [Alicyclobacillus sp. ALC3]WDL97766.1 histidinol dehydrogenase [Alicyclobacillus sp. ALC3]